MLELHYKFDKRDIFRFGLLFLWNIYAVIHKSIEIWFISGYFSFSLVYKKILIVFLFSLIYFITPFFYKMKEKLFIIIFICFTMLFNGRDIISLFPKEYYIQYTHILYFIVVILISLIILMISNKHSKYIERVLFVGIIIFLISGIGGFLWEKELLKGYVVNINDSNVNDNSKYENLPNIYFILPDAYIRPDMLEYYYGYDDSDFIEKMENRGFYYVKNSVANYVQTMLCLPSILNYTYIDSFVDVKRCKEVGALFISKHNPRIVRILRKLGYTTISIEIGSYAFLGLTGTDIMLYYPYSFRESLVDLIGYTPYFIGERIINPELGRELENIEVYKKNTFLIDVTVKSVTNTKKPHFVFAHLFAPHFPFVYDSLGNCMRYAKPMKYEMSTPDVYKRDYLSEVKYVNKIIISMVDTILKYDKNSIIVVSSDHGSDFYLERELDSTDIKERFSNMIFLYFPNKDYSDIPDNLSSVNIFRLVLSRITRKEYKLLDNRIYFSEPNKPFGKQGIIDITERYWREIDKVRMENEK